jgi:hypothetical protein
MIAAAGSAFAASPRALLIVLQGIDAPQPPRLVGDTLVLSVKPQRPARMVGARFETEGWRILHRFELNDNGVFVMDYPVPEGVREIRYRIVVDGLWMSDPENPQVTEDDAGNELSVFTLDAEPLRPVFNPRLEGDGSITFTFKGAPGRRVSIVGDFNNWDPFMEPMRETADGTYSITVRLPAGRHWYYFFTDGRRVLDPYNPESGVDPDGLRVSSFSLRS